MEFDQITGIGFPRCMEAHTTDIRHPEDMFPVTTDLKLRILDEHEGIIGTRSTLRSEHARINKFTIFPRSQIEGSINKNWIYFSLRANQSSSVFLNRTLSAGGESTVTLINHDEFFACCNENYSIYSVGVSYDHLAEYWDLDSVDPELLKKTSIYRIPSWFRYRISRHIQSLMNNDLDDSEFENRDADIMMTLLSFLSDSTRVSTKNRYRIIQTSIEYVRANVYRRISPVELAEASHCSMRTLQYAFRKTLGLSPKQFVDRYRLNRFRDDLLRSGQDSVIGLATKYDFQHAGNLSRVYKQLFGETPSRTLSLREPG